MSCDRPVVAGCGSFGGFGLIFIIILILLLFPLFGSGCGGFAAD